MLLAVSVPMETLIINFHRGDRSKTARRIRKNARRRIRKSRRIQQLRAQPSYRGRL